MGKPLCSRAGLAFGLHHRASHFGSAKSCISQARCPKVCRAVFLLKRATSSPGTFLDFSFQVDLTCRSVKTGRAFLKPPKAHPQGTVLGAADAFLSHSTGSLYSSCKTSRVCERSNSGAEAVLISGGQEAALTNRRPNRKCQLAASPSSLPRDNSGRQGSYSSSPVLSTLTAHSKDASWTLTQQDSSPLAQGSGMAAAVPLTQRLRGSSET